ncbi:MAG: deoxyribodipyrimidine photo-lyase [Xanthomonadales bacterium]|nr:deoxyribodipyrimidine photo-lyase [Xanthomonadales bacterium]
MSTINIVWFRQDLRIQDNPMLAAAAATGIPVLPLYIHAPEEAGVWPAGGASKWWLHHALNSLQAELEKSGLPLILRHGSSEEQLNDVLQSLAKAGYRVNAVISNRLYEPAAVQRDMDVQQFAVKRGIGWEQFNASLLVEPEHITNQSGLPYRVFTPFWKKLRQIPMQPPVRVDIKQLKAPASLPLSLKLAQLNLLPNVRWDTGLQERWNPSLAGAQNALSNFLTEAVGAYKIQRDLPAVNGTSSLSPYLHFGQLGPRQVWAATHAAGAQESNGGFTFLSELVWREFAYHLLLHFPHTDLQVLNPRYADFPWQPDKRLLRAWQLGQTGYPFIDAGMRQLWNTGWMHNRVRMVTASFLIKHLLQPWQDGARWFWDTLVDADLASNSMGWQWVAGSGADAAPYFRIFNPFGQGEKFDTQGDFVRRWVPELAKLPDSIIHRPWEASAMELKMAGVNLGKNYPHPIIDHKRGRERALEALQSLKSAPDKDT